MRKNKENLGDELGLNTTKFRLTDPEVDNNVNFLFYTRKATHEGIP